MSLRHLLRAPDCPLNLTTDASPTPGPGSVINLDLANDDTRGTTYDALNVGGTLTYGGTLNLTFTGSGLAGELYDLFNFTDDAGTDNFAHVNFAINGAPAVAAVSGVGRTWTATTSTVRYTFNAGTGNLTLAAVPEPAGWGAVLGLGLGGLALRRCRCRCAAGRAMAAN